MNIDIKNENRFYKIRQYLPKIKKLNIKGNLQLLDNPIVAIVGSRKCSAYGEGTAFELAKALSQKGITIVSGLAKGIDTAAHKGALSTNGNTIAVIGNGINVYYPFENKDLQNEIIKKGLLISEYDDDITPMPYRFPERNAIISALADIVIVVQAGVRSGALITAEIAMEQGKEVFAVPGNINSQYNFGCNKIISEGANILTSIGDIYSFLDIKENFNKEQIASDLVGIEKQVILELLNNGEMSIYQLMQSIKIERNKLYEILTLLELKGLIFNEMGKVGIVNIWN